MLQTPIIQATTMIVKILKASNPGYWYAGFVGQMFNVEDYNLIDTDKIEKYVVVPTPGTDPLFMISIEDCTLVHCSRDEVEFRISGGRLSCIFRQETIRKLVSQ